jgi:hypothetical protein
MIKTIGLYLFAILIIWAVVILQFVPSLPSTVLGWIFLVVLGPPLYLLGEWVFEKIFSTERGRRMSDKRFSVKRVSFALMITVPFLLFIFFISYLFEGM